MSNNNLGNKRQRSTNFNIRETECLVQEILKRASVIENKQTDAITWKQKENAWIDLTEKFNTITASNRTEKMLKVKYDGIKRAIKQKHNKAKAEQYKTGGGVPEIIQYTAWEEKLFQIISLSVEGLPTQNDCDQVVNIQNDIEEDVEIPEGPEALSIIPGPSTSGENKQHPEKTIEGTIWNSYTPTTLKAPRHKKLKSTPQINSNNVSLINKREDLIEFQKKIPEQESEKILLEMDLLRKEDIRKEEMHKLKMEILKLEKEKLIINT